MDLGCPYEAGLALLGSADEASLREALWIFSDLGASAAVRFTRRGSAKSSGPDAGAGGMPVIAG
jgi:hypothetical protein